MTSDATQNVAVKTCSAVEGALELCVLKDESHSQYIENTLNLFHHSFILFSFLKTSPMINESSTLISPCNRVAVFCALPVTSFCSIRTNRKKAVCFPVFYIAQWE